MAKLDKKMKIDFGGIAKGYTSSEVMKVFKNNGIKSGWLVLVEMFRHLEPSLTEASGKLQCRIQIVMKAI